MIKLLFKIMYYSNAAAAAIPSYVVETTSLALYCLLR